ncbi:MAG: hypothetical protein ACR2IV_18185, partial [Bryobacteraceae bacterium]
MCRFAHYLKCIVRDRIGSFQSTDDLTRFLNSWLAQFVCSDRTASEEVRARYPLGQAEIRDATVDATRGQVTASFSMLPRFQLEGLTQPLRLRVKFPVLLTQGLGSQPARATVEPSSTSKPQDRSLPDSNTYDPPFAPPSFRVLDSLAILHGSRTSRLSICHGDLTQIPESEAVDLLVLSAFPDEYEPVSGSVIGALQEKGISVEHLARNKAVDLRHAFSCWLSEEILEQSEGIRFRRILCFEPLTRGRPTEIVGEIFQSLMPFANGAPPIARIAMPRVACGQQGVGIAEMLEPLVDAAVHWLKHGLPVDELKIVEQSAERAAEMKRVFAILKTRYS